MIEALLVVCELYFTMIVIFSVVRAGKPGGQESLGIFSYLESAIKKDKEKKAKY